MQRAVKRLRDNHSLTTTEALDTIACRLSPAYFVTHFCYIYDPVSVGWIPFNLWKAQARVLKKIHYNDKVIVLKSRQVGITWLALCYILWLMLFQAPSVCVAVSRKEADAMRLLSVERLRGIYSRLPAYLQADEIVKDDVSTFMISRDGAVSSVSAVSRSGADGIAGSMVFVDEADLIPDLRKMLLSVEPVVNAGGKLLLVSKSDKSNPLSHFKRLFRSAMAGTIAYVADFIAWYEHPGRDEDWYEQQKALYLETEGALDGLFESYPATIEEALAPNASNKRFPFEWLSDVFHPLDPIRNALGIPHLTVYSPPKSGMVYSIGVDCAEGLPNSDNSVSIVVNAKTGTHVATLCGLIPPDLHAQYTAMLAEWYNNAPQLVERNNHGHAYLNTQVTTRNAPIYLRGDDNRMGFQTNSVSKVHLADEAAAILRERACTIADPETQAELASIEINTLKAPEGMKDDRAIAFMLAQKARKYVFQQGAREPISFNAREWGI